MLLFASSHLLFAQTLRYPKPPNAKNGEKMFKSGGIAGQGSEARGTPQTTAGFERPDTFPDFTKCDQTTTEPNSVWKDVIVHGGPSRGFSQIMPAFGELLTSEQIDDVIAYLRTFCTNKHWARGELNLPRALITEKAYPEDEVVISTAVNARSAPGVTTDVIHEQRFGVKNQIEIDVPLNFQDQNHTWYGGLVGTTLPLKREIFSSLQSGSILSLQGGVLVPTGNKTRGFGTGTTTFETFAAFDQLFRTNTFLQTQIGADLPPHTNIAPQSMFCRIAVGQSFAASRRHGRLWSPMVEFVAARDLSTGAKTNWDIVPEMQVTISRRQHIRANLGVRTPATNTTGRPVQAMMSLLFASHDTNLTNAR